MSVLVLPSSSTVVMGRRKGQINNVTGPVIEKEGNETEGSFHSVVSCLWKLVDVSQVGVVEDYSDSIQRVRLSYSLQLYLGPWTNKDRFIQTILSGEPDHTVRQTGMYRV